MRRWLSVLLVVTGCAFELPGAQPAPTDTALPPSDAAGPVDSDVGTPPVDMAPIDAPDEGGRNQCFNLVDIGIFQNTIECDRENGVATCTCRQNGTITKTCVSLSLHPCASPTCCGF